MTKLLLVAAAVVVVALGAPGPAVATSPWQHGPARVWIPGHWERIDHGGRHFWVPGQWVASVAPHRHGGWDGPHRWQDGRHWDDRRFYDEPRGHWDWRYGRQVWIPHSWR